MGLNRVLLIGEAAQTPALRWVGEHEAVSEFRLRIEKHYRTLDGAEKTARTEVPVVVYGELAERCASSGAGEVLIEGRLRQESWKGDDGKQRTRYCVVADRCEFSGKPLGPPVGEAPRRAVREHSREPAGVGA